MPVVERARAELRATAAAVAFLTLVPVGRALRLAGGDLRMAAPAFPLVGAAVGATAGACGVLLAHQVAPAVAGAIALVVAVALTGGLHLDGLADTADALGARTVDDALRIMREPQVGSYGVTAVALVLIVDAAALAELVAARRIAEVAAAFALARAVAPVIAAVLPYARQGSGLARSIAAGGRLRAVCGALVALGFAGLVAREQLGVLLIAVGCCTIAATTLFRLRFGGMTGDTLGAAIAVTEAACLVVVSTGEFVAR